MSILFKSNVSALANTEQEPFTVCNGNLLAKKKPYDKEDNVASWNNSYN